MFKFGDVARHGQSLLNRSDVPFRGGISVLELRPGLGIRQLDLDCSCRKLAELQSRPQICRLLCRICRII